MHEVCITIDACLLKQTEIMNYRGRLKTYNGENIVLCIYTGEWV